MRRAIVSVLILATACAAPAAQRPTSGATPRAVPAATRSPDAGFAEGLCRRTLPDRRVTAWGTTTVGAMRAYRYGGPVATRPLADAFPGAPSGRRGAWCWVRNMPNTGSLWGAAGSTARRAVTVTGPQPDAVQGVLHRPVQVP